MVFHDYYLSVQALDSQSVSSCFGSSKKSKMLVISWTLEDYSLRLLTLQMSIDALSSTVQSHGYRKSQTALHPSAKWLCDLGINQLTSLCWFHIPGMKLSTFSTSSQRRAGVLDQIIHISVPFTSPKHSYISHWLQVRIMAWSGDCILRRMMPKSALCQPSQNV